MLIDFIEFSGECFGKYGNSPPQDARWSSEDRDLFDNLRKNAQARVGRIMRDANFQLEDTKRVLNQPDAYSLALITNDLAGYANEYVLTWLMNNLLEPTLGSTYDTQGIDGFMYVQHLTGRKTFDNKDSWGVFHLRNRPRSAKLLPIVLAIFDVLYPNQRFYPASEFWDSFHKVR